MCCIEFKVDLLCLRWLFKAASRCVHLQMVWWYCAAAHLERNNGATHVHLLLRWSVLLSKVYLNAFLSSEKLWFPNKFLSQKLKLYSLNSVLWLVSRSTWFRSFTFVDIKILCDAHQGDESSCARDAITYFFQISMRSLIKLCCKFERSKSPRFTCFAG